jgi:4-amino-4-deoxy-L-arabinose transferase-like glycosyltransferase
MPASRSPLLLPIAVAIVLRIVLALAAWRAGGAAAFLAGDSPTYLTPAASLASRGAFLNLHGTPELFRPPGYPLLLAVGCLFGHPTFFALAAQLALSAGIVAGTYTIARRLFGDGRIATVCAFAAAIEPTMLLWSVKVMTETLFTFLLVVFVLAALRALETMSPARAVAAGCVLAAAIYVKPIAYPLVPLLWLAALLARGVWRAGLSWKQAFVFLLTCVVLLAPWHLRNARQTGYAGFSTLFDYTLYLSAGGSVSARHEQKPYSEVRGRMLHEAANEPSESVRYASMRRQGWARFASDPAAYARIHAAGMARTLLDPGAVEYLRTLRRYPAAGGALTHSVDVGLLRGTVDAARRYPLAFGCSAALGVVLLPLLILPLVAATRLAPHHRPAFLTLALLAVYFVTASGGVAGSSRFRAPIVPILILMSGFALERNRAGVL